MPIAPKPYKLKCPQCGYSKTVHPKSDVVNGLEDWPICPKCNSKMDREKLTGISKYFDSLFR